MALTKIPLDPARGKQTFITTLGATRFRFRFRYLRRPESWYMDLLTVDDVTLLSGVRVDVNTRTLRQYRSHAGFPDGEVVLVDLQDQNDKPDRDEIVSERRLLVFIDGDDEDDFFGTGTTLDIGSPVGAIP